MGLGGLHGGGHSGELQSKMKGWIKTLKKK